MAQGKTNLKAKSGKGPGRITKMALQPKRCQPLNYQAKRGTAKDTAKLSKSHQGKLMNSTERLIASRVGHLELIKGSRRSIEKENKEKERLKAGKK